MKRTSIIVTLLLFVAQAAVADQLAWLTQKQADQAISVLKRHKQIMLFCGCCKGDKKELMQLTHTFTKFEGKDNNISYYSIVAQGKIDGKMQEKNLDLAYVYINSHGTATCLGKALHFECDPCASPFPWPGRADEPAQKKETLIFNIAENYGQGDWALTFSHKNNRRKKIKFMLSQHELSKLPYSFVNDVMMTNKKYINKTFEVTHYRGERENGATGEIEPANMIRSISLVKNAANTTHRNMDLAKVRYQTDKLMKYYESLGLGDVSVAVPSAEDEKGIMPYNNLLPNFNKLRKIKSKRLKQNQLDGSWLYYKLYDKNIAVEESEYTTSIFYVGKFTTDHFQLKAGMKRQEVEALLHEPYEVKGGVMIYLSPDPSEEPNQYSEPYYGATRLFFDKNGLKAIWIVQKN